jgi:hypothetical protein
MQKLPGRFLTSFAVAGMVCRLPRLGSFLNSKRPSVESYIQSAIILCADLKLFAFAEMIDPSALLAKIEGQITQAKQDKETRGAVVSQVEKFVHALEQEEWLDEFEKVSASGFEQGSP